MSIKENVKRAKSDFDEVYNAGIEVGKKIGGESVAPNLQDKLITENGEYTPDEGYDGLSKVTVQVASSGGGDNSKLLKLISGEEVSLTAEDLSGITAVRDYAFSASKLTDVELPSGITQIGKNAFRDCTKLISVALPEGVITISDYAFNNSTLLSRITLPYTLKTISTYAFYNCKSLSSIELPENLTSLGQSSFNLSGIASIVIPKGITAIPNYIFSGCSALTHVTARGYIKTISTNAFNACIALECLDLTACTSITTLSSVNNLKDIPTTCQIKVPAHLYESWKSATNWSTYASRIVAVPVIKIDDDVYKIEEGMTWGEWIVSEYAPEGKFIVYVDNIRVAENNNYVVELQSGSPATPDTVMHSGDEYYQSEP